MKTEVPDTFMHNMRNKLTPLCAYQMDCTDIKLTFQH